VADRRAQQADIDPYRYEPLTAGKWGFAL